MKTDALPFLHQPTAPQAGLEGGPASGTTPAPETVDVQVPQGNSKLIAFGLLGLLSLIWGSSFILMKVSLRHFGALEVAALRMAFAGLAMLPIALAQFRNVPRNAWPALSVVSYIGSGLPALCFTLSLGYLTTTTTGALNALTPLATLVVGVLFFASVWRRAALVGVLLGLVGTLFLLSTGGGGFSISIWGLLPIAACVCYGVSVNTIKSRLGGFSPMLVTACSLLTILPVVLGYLALGPFRAQWAAAAALGPTAGSELNGAVVWGGVPQVWLSLLAVAVLGIVGTAVAMLLYTRLIQMTTAVFASAVTYLIPVVALAWGVYAGEEVLALHLLGLALILLGVRATAGASKAKAPAKAAEV